MFAEHFHHSPIGREVIIFRENLGNVTSLGDFENILPAVGVVLIWTEHTEIAALQIQLHHVAQKLSLHSGRFGRNGTSTWDFDRVLAEVWHAQVLEEQSTVGVR